MSDNSPPISTELLARIAKVTGKRPRTVLQHIVEHGFVTTDELREKHRYKHPPRGARDVREAGFTLKTTMVAGPDGRRMARYTLVEDDTVRAQGGRRAFPKSFKNALLAHYGLRCAICNGEFPGRALQIDHRVPYEVAGDVSGDRDIHDYLLLCPSCNRTKSWSCEHCVNGQGIKDAAICRTCMWGSPEGYAHIATRARRSLTVTWDDIEVEDYETILRIATESGMDLRDYIKQRIKVLLPPV